MLCRSIEVSRFRNIREARVEFSPGVNVLCGENAQGKTNLLEAIYYAAIAKSFRGQSNAEVISFGEGEARISLDYFGREREQNITLHLYRGKARTIERNGVPVGRSSALVGELRAVLFCPEHLSLIKDGPAERRQFLDIAISSMEPVYLRALQRYNQCLKQRNALLKRTAGADGREQREALVRELEVWSRQLAAEGAVIADRRARYVKKAEQYVQECFQEMTGERETPTLRYLGGAKEETALYEDRAACEQLYYRQLTKNTERELAAGATLYGIHKDDMEVLLNGRAARSYCSQGQQRSLALALKLSEGELCREDCGEYPVLLFDDVLSELDRSRRQYLLERIREKQVILTTCEGDLTPGGRQILVENGTYIRRS